MSGLPYDNPPDQHPNPQGSSSAAAYQQPQPRASWNTAAPAFQPTDHSSNVPELNNEGGKPILSPSQMIPQHGYQIHPAQLGPNIPNQYAHQPPPMLIHGGMQAAPLVYPIQPYTTPLGKVRGFNPMGQVMVASSIPMNINLPLQPSSFSHNQLDRSFNQPNLLNATIGADVPPRQNEQVMQHQPQHHNVSMQQQPQTALRQRSHAGRGQGSDYRDGGGFQCSEHMYQQHPNEFPLDHEDVRDSQMSLTLPHQKSRNNQEDNNMTFSGFERRTNTQGRAYTREEPPKVWIRPRNGEKTVNKKSTVNRDSQQPQNRESSSTSCNLSYRFNKSLISNGSSIPIAVIRDDEGLHRIINGLIKDVLCLQQFVHILAEERDAAIATKVNMQRNTSTQTRWNTKEKEVQTVTSPLEISPVTTDESAEPSATAATLPSKYGLIARKVTEEESSTPTIKNIESPETPQVTEEKPLVNGQQVEDIMIPENMSDIEAPTIKSLSLAENMGGCDGHGKQKEPNQAETPILENPKHGHADNPSKSSSNADRITKTSEILYNSGNVKNGVESRVDDGKQVVERKRCEAEQKTKIDDQKHSVRLAEANSSKEKENEVKDDQQTFRRAKYADITRINLPKSPAAPSKPRKNQIIKELSSPQETSREKVSREGVSGKTTPPLDNRQKLSDGFVYPKKSLPSPMLTNEDLQRAFSTRRLFDSPVLKLVHNPRVESETTPLKKNLPHQCAKKSAKKRTPTPKEVLRESAEDFDDFISDEKKIKEFSSIIKGTLPNYSAKMKNFICYFCNWPQDRPILDSLLEQLTTYWLENPSREYSEKESKRVMENLDSRMESLEAKSDLTSRKLYIFLELIFASEDSLSTDDVFHCLLLPDKNEQLCLLLQYMQLIVDFDNWEHRLDIPPLKPSNH